MAALMNSGRRRQVGPCLNRETLSSLCLYPDRAPSSRSSTGRPAWRAHEAGERRVLFLSHLILSLSLYLDRASSRRSFARNRATCLESA
jgi:hypothetical protein